VHPYAKPFLKTMPGKRRKTRRSKKNRLKRERLLNLGMMPKSMFLLRVKSSLRS
jgi:hypothetical protein